MFEKLVVIDCKNHLMGRLASIVAKEGLLPVGAHTWKISASALGKPSGSGREGRTLTVALVTA